ncbi:MAG: acyl--CoA ligase [Mucispirillum sp.]|nr:acyl--CoA ligase [Mucispirillum sp.]
MTIVKAVYENSKKYPNRLAISGSDGDITYGELWEYTNKFAAYLHTQGLIKGDTVVLHGMQNTAFTVILLGTLLSGGIIVPVDKNITELNLNKVIRETKSKYVFTPDRIKDMDLGWIKNLLRNIPMKNHEFPPEEDVSDILFTTGTTGTPEGIIHTNKSHYATVENILGLIEMKNDNVSIIAAPLNHSFALRRFYANIVHGSSVIVLENILPLNKLFNIIDKYGDTSIAMNPSALAIILRYGGESIGKYKNRMDYMELGGSTLTLDLLHKIVSVLPDTKIYNIYGSTEAGCMTGCSNAELSKSKGGIGKANINSDIYILDKNRNIIEGCGETNSGYLAIKSPIVMKGYLNNPAKDDEVLQNGYYITKDIVYKDEEGFYYLVGREDDVISIGGLKVSPDEVENVVRKYDGILDCACVAKPDEAAGQIPVLFVVSEGDLNQSALYKYMSLNMEPYKCPKDIRIIGEIPKTFNGKILRRQLRDMI